MNVDDKYSRRNMLNFRKQLEAQLSKKKNNSSEIFLSFLKYAFNLDHLEKKMSILAELFLELFTPKEVVT